MTVTRTATYRDEGKARRVPLPAGSLPAPARDWALFVDLDGTLFDIESTPQAVCPDPALGDLLERIAGLLGGAAAVVSGRTLADIDRMLAPCRIAAAALHGAELRATDGTVTRLPVDRPALAAIGARFDAFAATRPGVLIESKGAAVAMHYRNAPALAREARALAAEAVAPHAASLIARPGKALVEVRPRGIDKGSAIAAFLATPPFAGRRPVMVGDDITDEDGFAQARRGGGIAVIVGNGRRRTHATHRLASVAAVRAWLASLPAALAASDATVRQGAGRAGRRRP